MSDIFLQNIHLLTYPNHLFNKISSVQAYSHIVYNAKLQQHKYIYNLCKYIKQLILIIVVYDFPNGIN